MNSKDRAYSLIKKSGNLPTLPAILLKLLAACDNDETPMSEIAAIISKDPVLSFKVLQLVNSAYYGFRYSFQGIDQAVVYLGANTIKNIAVTMSVHQVFERKRFKKIKQFNTSIFWYHSLMCATLAKRIARKTGYGNLDEAYLTGLLHDMGSLVLLATFPEEHQQILENTEGHNSTLWAETQLLGINHCEAGSLLVENWQMGSMMADAIRYHHEPLEQIKGAFPLVKIVYAAASLLNKNSDSGIEYESIVELLGELPLSDLEEITAGATEEVEQIAASMEIEIIKPSQANEAKTNEQSEKISTETSRIIKSPDDISDEEVLQEALTSRIKNVSLLTGFLENLAMAGDIEGIMMACEQAMSLLFNIDKVIFFLKDTENILLEGRTSQQNSLRQSSQGLNLTMEENSSLIVKTHQSMGINWLSAENSTENLADRQLLTILGCRKILLLPLLANKEPAGVILLGLPQEQGALASDDHKLLKVVAQQVGICLELERMKEQKAADLNAERMSAISMTTKKIAHEINNPLGIISNYLASIKLRLTDDEKIQQELSIVDEEIHRISSMISQMDLFSQDSTNNFELTDVNATIHDIVQLQKAAHFATSGFQLRFFPDETLQPIVTCKNSIKQILINLVKNATEAMKSSGRVRVTTRAAEKSPTGYPMTKGIEIEVRDSGPGLPDSVAASLYSPFVTTKRNGHSGLGLSIVHKAVTDLAGTISHTSSPVDGTCFTIFLPDSEQIEQHSLQQRRMR